MKGYRYRNGDLVTLHTTSVPQTDEAALAYVKAVESWFPGESVTYIQKREDEPLADYHFMKIEIVDGEVRQLDGAA